jgi:hypothetical protein
MLMDEDGSYQTLQRDLERETKKAASIRDQTRQMSRLSHNIISLATL